MTPLGFSLFLFFVILFIGSILWRSPNQEGRRIDRKILGLFQEDEYITLQEIESRYLERFSKGGSPPLTVLHVRIGSLLLEKRLKKFNEVSVQINTDYPRPTSTRQVYALSKE